MVASGLGISASPREGRPAPLLESLDAEQRAAALLPDGPALIIAPAGSGKTTTLIARLGVLLDRGVPPEQIAVVTFNRAAAVDLADRLARRLAPSMPGAGRIEVRTLHALARQILLDAGVPVRLAPDRLPLLRAARRRAAVSRGSEDPPLPEAAALDTIVSAWKVEQREPPPGTRPIIEAYADLLALRGELDFDDLVAGAVARLDAHPALRLRWQARFSHLAVDEFQDVDAAQFRLVQILAAPQDNLFVVGDDDQTIYAWRLADVRRMLDFDRHYPGARRVQLATNYRCPRSVVAASARLVAVNRERYVKVIHAAPGRHAAAAEIAELPTDRPEWPDLVAAEAARAAAATDRCCVLARTRAELIPVQLAMLRMGLRHATSLAGPLEAEPVVRMLDGARRLPGTEAPFGALLRLRTVFGWRRGGEDDSVGDEHHAALDALLGWAAAFRTLNAFLAGADAAAARMAALRDPSAPIELVTVHGSKGREWPTVIIIGFEEERMPNRRARVDAADPARALEEERRLAYVALTRATQRLVLAFDPQQPSPFLVEMGLRLSSAG